MTSGLGFRQGQIGGHSQRSLGCLYQTLTPHRAPTVQLPAPQRDSASQWPRQSAPRDLKVQGGGETACLRPCIRAQAGTQDCARDFRVVEGTVVEKILPHHA